MTLAAVRNTEQIDGSAVPTVYELGAAVDINYAGGMACLNAAGYVEPAAASAGQTAVLGRVERTVDNSGGSVGDLHVLVLPGQFKWDNSGTSIAITDVGSLCYAVDDEAVHISNAGGRPIAGMITRVDTDGVVVQTIFHSAALAAAGGGAGITSGPTFYARGASTANIANLASFTVANDGITLVEGEYFLAKDQAATEENGLYVVGVVAAGSAPLTRAPEMDDAAELVPNVVVRVSEGTDNIDTEWTTTTNATIVVGTTALTWVDSAYVYGLAAAMAAQTIAAAAAGTANEASRVDHNHAYSTAAAVATYDTNAEGAATSFARSDHTHAVTGINQVLATVNITSADLTTAGVGPETENIGAAISQSAIVTGYRISLVDAFDNGAGVSLTLEVGHTNDVDAYEDGFDLFTGSAYEGAGYVYVTTGPGIGAPAFDGTSVGQCVATITAGADQLANFTNGDVTIDILGYILA